ncbi:MAG: hypothetical protein F9K29_14055 [Hyphomicrobiaceae bacterium]|nr:MAG: hypothetical protein F9K29_14055 [Hyphomicrobiaceae bacterium]
MSNWSIDFSPMVPGPLFWVGAVLAAALVALLLVRRSRGALLRALSLAALLLALANPTLRQEERESLANIAIVVLDESMSQSIAGRPEQAQAIRKELETKLGGIGNLQVRWVSSSKPTGDAASGTNLFTDLNSALANTPPDRLAGVVMITDGQVHDVPKSVAALGFDAPVHALLTGRPGEFDRRIEIIKAPRYGIVGEKKELCERTGPERPVSGERNIQFRIVEEGRRSPPGETVQVRIRREGRRDEMRRVPIGRIVNAEMDFPHAGQNIVEIEAEGAPGELTLMNNRAVIVAEGVRDNLRVLLVSGEPHAGERTWRNLLRSDAAVDLVHFTILRPPQKQDGTPIHQLSLIAFPTRELFSEKINCFDLIIFDRYQHRDILQLLYYENIARYVDQGGALLVAAGDDFAGQMSLSRTPLATVLPATPTGRLLEQPFKAKLSVDGAKHPVTRGLPGSEATEPSWGRWFRQVDVVPSRGRVVMNGAENRPLLLLDRKGRGRVALLLSDHAWLWARGYEGGGPHTDLLRRLAHWLMKEPDLEEERLRATAKGLKLTIERRSMEESVPPVQLSAPGGETTEVVLDKAGPGLWRATVDVKAPGLYKMQSQAPSGPLTAVAHAGIEDAREMSEVTATEDKMKALVEATGGGMFWTRGGGLLSSASSTAVDLPRISMLANAKVLAGSGWMGLKDREAYITRGVKLIPMFTGFLALAALLALLAVTWWREGQ